MQEVPEVPVVQEVQVAVVVLGTQDVQELQEVQEGAPHVLAQLQGVAGRQLERSRASLIPQQRCRSCCCSA